MKHPNIKLRPVPEPVGAFIVRQKTEYVLTEFGAYYHYTDVCSLLDRMKRIEQLRAYRVVYWRNVFEIRYENESAPDVIKGIMSCYHATLISCNAFILDRIRELQQEIYPPLNPTT